MKLFQVGDVYFTNKAEAKALRNKLNMEWAEEAPGRRVSDGPWRVMRGPDHRLY